MRSRPSREDDGSATSVSGLGDQSVEGVIKEFAAESDGYIVVVVNADVDNPPPPAVSLAPRKSNSCSPARPRIDAL
jgi:hypothetical protein